LTTFPRMDVSWAPTPPIQFPGRYPPPRPKRSYFSLSSDGINRLSGKTKLPSSYTYVNGSPARLSCCPPPPPPPPPFLLVWFFFFFFSDDRVLDTVLLYPFSIPSFTDPVDVLFVLISVHPVKHSTFVSKTLRRFPPRPDLFFPGFRSPLVFFFCSFTVKLTQVF